MSDQSVALQGFWDRNVNYFSLLPSEVKPQVSHGDVPCFCYARRHRAGDAVPFESPHTSGRCAPVSAANRTLSSSLWVLHPSTAGLSAGCLCGKCHGSQPAARSSLGTYGAPGPAMPYVSDEHRFLHTLSGSNSPKVMSPWLISESFCERKILLALPLQKWLNDRGMSARLQLSAFSAFSLLNEIVKCMENNLVFCTWSMCCTRSLQK